MKGTNEDFKFNVGDAVQLKSESDIDSFYIVEQRGGVMAWCREIDDRFETINEDSYFCRRSNGKGILVMIRQSDLVAYSHEA